MSKYSDKGCRLSFNDAREKIAKYDEMSDSEFGVQVCRWAKHIISRDDGYKPICDDVRNRVVGVFDETVSKGSLYKVDLEVGLELYGLLDPDKPEESGFTVVDASDDDFWRYLSVVVFPDLTFIRYPNRRCDFDCLEIEIPGLKYSGSKGPEKGSARIRKKRFYSHTRRIWLKTLWWYIYLSWQGDAESTRKILEDNGVNIIGQLIERPGIRGYRVELFRAMMKELSTVKERRDAKFCVAAKLNLAKCYLVEPSLTEGGEERYVENLFREITDTSVEDMEYDEGYDIEELEEDNR